MVDPMSVGAPIGALTTRFGEPAKTPSRIIGDLSNTEDVIPGLRLDLDQPG
jgi:hypothetical protein